MTHESGKGGQPSPVTIFIQALVTRDWRFITFTVAGSGTAALIAIFQFAVLSSFIAASAAVPRYLNADIWVSAYGVSAFDFGYPIPSDYGAALVSYFPGASYRRVLVAFAPWNSPSGHKSNVVVVGVDGIEAPLRTLIVDKSELDDLRMNARNHHLPEIGQTRFDSAIATDGLATFLGVPYVISNFDDAATALGVENDYVSFIAIDTQQSHGQLREIIHTINSKYPEITVLTAHDFERQTATYWLFRTGAGAAIFLAAILAAVIMVLFLVSGVSRFISQYTSDFLTIVGLGYGADLVLKITLVVSVLLAVSPVLLAALALPFMEFVTDSMLPWVDVKPLDLGFGCILALVGAGIAWRTSNARIVQFDLAGVFR